MIEVPSVEELALDPRFLQPCPVCGAIRRDSCWAIRRWHPHPLTYFHPERGWTEQMLRERGYTQTTRTLLGSRVRIWARPQQ